MTDVTDLDRRVRALERLVDRLTLEHTGLPIHAVYAEYRSDAGQSIAHNTLTVINYEDRIIDTHNAVTTGAAWKFTCPAPGVYEMVAYVLLQASGDWAESGEYAYLRAIVNGSGGKVIDRKPRPTTAGVATIGGVWKGYLNLNDTLAVAMLQTSGVSLNLVNSALYTWIAIHRVFG